MTIVALINDRKDEATAMDPLFDTWLQTSLQRLYDATLDEAVPEDLLQILPEAFETKRSC